MVEPLLAGLSKIINAYLRLDPESTKRLHRLQDKIIRVELLPLHLTLHYHFSPSGLKIIKANDETVDATITGTPLQLLAVALHKENRQQFFSDDLEIAGDADVANQMIKLFDELHVDLENELSRFVGDKTAYHLSNFFQNTKKWFQTTVESFTENVNEYTHEEASLFPPNEALQHFFNETDELRMAVDRFAMRVENFSNEMEREPHLTSFDEG